MRRMGRALAKLIMRLDRTRSLMGLRLRSTHPTGCISEENERVDTIELDASSWETAHDFRSALKAALGAPNWHGDTVGAFLDSIFGGGMNAVKPPYVIRIANAADISPELKELIHDFSSAVEETRMRRLARIGENVAVSVEVKK